MIFLPRYVSSISAFEAMIFCQEALQSTNDNIDIDARYLRFTDPFGIALLGACFHEIKTRSKKIRIHNLNANLSGYLQRMDLFEGTELIDCQPERVSRHNRANSLVELTMLSQHSKVGDVSDKLANAIVGGFGDVDPNEPEDEMTGFNMFYKLVQPLQYALNELLENSLTHARRSGNKDASVWIASQYYPNNGLIRLGVVDNGCGFLESLQNHPTLTSKRHLNAILLALQPRISCNRELGLRGDTRNQGVGLTTSSRIVQHAGGRMVLISGNAMHDTLGKSQESINNLCFWHGVGIAIECQRSKLADVRFRELLPPLDDIPPARLRFEQ